MHVEGELNPAIKFNSYNKLSCIWICTFCGENSFCHNLISQWDINYYLKKQYLLTDSPHFGRRFFSSFFSNKARNPLRHLQWFSPWSVHCILYINWNALFSRLILSKNEQLCVEWLVSCQHSSFSLIMLCNIVYRREMFTVYGRSWFTVYGW